MWCWLAALREHLGWELAVVEHPAVLVVSGEEEKEEEEYWRQANILEYWRRYKNTVEAAGEHLGAAEEEQGELKDKKDI